MDPNYQGERSLPLLQCGDFVQGTYGQSEMQRSDLLDGGKEGSYHSPKNMEEVNETLIRRTSISAMLQSPQKPSHRTDGSGTSWLVDNGGDRQVDTVSKSNRVAQLEEMVSRLKNALISLEEENLLLNKKVKESIAAPETVDCGSPGYKPKTPLERSNTDQMPHERLIQVMSWNAEVQRETCKSEDTSSNDEQHEDGPFPPGKEKQDVHRKLKKVEEYCKECTKELGRVLRKYEEIRGHNKALEKQCKQLTAENQRLAKSLGSLKGEPQSTLEERAATKALLDQAHERCTKVGREKEELEAKVLSLTGEVARLREELGASRLETQKTCDQSALLEAEAQAAMARMGEEAWLLQGKLREREERWELYESTIRKLREEQAVLENCLRTVQKERDLLQQEVRKLHQDYIELSSTISLQLRAKSSSRSSTSVPSGPQDPPSCSLFIKQDKIIGEEKIDQIRKRLEEEELIRAQKYKDIIDKSV